jgi:hypothetical protein
VEKLTAKKIALGTFRTNVPHLPDYSRRCTVIPEINVGPVVLVDVSVSAKFTNGYYSGLNSDME